ncbi:Replication protein [compost metagenome]
MDHSAELHRDIAGAGKGAQAPLGTTAKCSSPPPREKAKRAGRYSALSTAREWMFRRAQLVDREKNPGDIYRTHDCKWARRKEHVDVFFDALHQGAHYGGLATCGSVWACPVCAAKVQQRRREELTQLVSWTYDQELEPVMVTLTFPHTRFDSLGDLLSKQRQAFERLRSGKVWQKFKQKYGYTGLVRSLELTHGRNGWHPHTHELWIIRPLQPSERAAFHDFIRERWAKVCAKVGLLDMADAEQLRAFFSHSVDVRYQVNDSDYLAKQDSSRAWGVDRELASASSKSGRRSGVHPHEFLVRQAPGDYDLFLEYVDSMKGARQLFWSRGLKDLVGVIDQSDEELSEESQEHADLLGLLTAEQWRFVRGNDARAELLDAAETGGWAAVLALLASLGCELLAHEVNQLVQVDGLPVSDLYQQLDSFHVAHPLFPPSVAVGLPPPAS